MTTNAGDRLISLTEAANRVYLKPKTIRRYIAAGRIHGYRVGPRAIRVSAAEIEQLARAIPTAGD